MSPRHLVAMRMTDRGERSDAALTRLAEALPRATVGEPDQTGAFEIEVPADDLESALSQVWDAVAAAGADDHITFLEHPDLPGHWRRRTGGADNAGR